MKFWIYMFFSTLIMPSTLFLMSLYLRKKRNISLVSGYRTRRSIINQDTWDFAQQYCSKISLKLTLPNLLLSMVIMPFSIGKSVDTIGWYGFAVVMIQMLSFIIIIYATEKALKNNFDEYGNCISKSLK